MSGDLRPVLYHYRKEHAAKMRIVAGDLAKIGKTECIEVALYLHNLADKIDNAFRQSNVVDFRPRQPDPPEAA